MSITATVIILYLGFFAAFGIYLNRNNSTASDWAIGVAASVFSCWPRVWQALALAVPGPMGSQAM